MKKSRLYTAIVCGKKVTYSSDSRAGALSNMISACFATDKETASNVFRSALPIKYLVKDVKLQKKSNSTSKRS